MHPRSQLLTLATATLLLSFPLSIVASPHLVTEVAQAQTTEARKAEAERLLTEGVQQYRQSQFREALATFEKALVIFREIGKRTGEGTTLNNVGLVYDNLGQYPKALDYYQQALVIRREVGDRSGEGTTLNNIGLVYDNLGQYPKALDYYQQALVIIREIGNRSGEGTTLNNLGAVYVSLGQYPQALDYYQQALVIIREIGNRSGEGTTLNNIGVIYDNLGQYPQALDYFQQALVISREIGARSTEGRTLNNIGLVYSKLGQYTQALDYYQQSLVIRREIGDRSGEGRILNNIGFIYHNLGQYPKALDYYQQALVIIREIGDRFGEGATLNNIGLVYFSLGQYPQALDFYQQALVIIREIGNRSTEGTTLNNIGAVYSKLGQYPQALDFYQQALVIIREIGARNEEGTNLSNIGVLLEAQKQPQLAIVFLKQSVNVYENIRQDNKGLSKEQQQSYTETVAKTYRRLADILLQQDRILEAQRVLDLLKVQELDDYLRGVRGNENTQQGVENLPPEQQILAQYSQLQDSAIANGKELAQLRKIPEAQRTTAQKQRIAELDAQQKEIVKQYAEFMRRPDIIAYVQQLTQTAKDQNLKLASLRNMADNLRNLQQNAVLLYPLILDDRIELILSTPDSPPIRRTVTIEKAELNKVILEFRQALDAPSSNATIPAEKLYNWLIKPLEKDLATAEAKTIIYAPDSILRYIPLAALHDGKQWLVEKFAVNHITAASLTDFNTKPQVKLTVLAGAFSQGNYPIPLGKRKVDFSGLPFAGKEVEGLAAIIPQTTQLIDAQFSKKSTIPQMDDYSVVHFATHAAFVTGSPDDSVILFGNGEWITLAEVRDSWFLTNVDLVVLSACETGVGGELGNGEEILGFGYLMQNAGARAAIASLWSVDDGGTQVLMNTFYHILQTGKVSKTEALRQAQMALIQADETLLSQQRGGLGVIAESLPPKVKDSLAHPYYWAPFILIGNGL